MNLIFCLYFRVQVREFQKQLKCLIITKRNINYVSRLFQPQNIAPKNSKVKVDEVSSKSQRLMVDLGIVKQATSGSFHLLPLGERALHKLTCLVDEEMERIGAQKLLLPLLTPGELWRKTGRWDETREELFTLQDRHNKEFVLSPTHEEAITELVATISKLSYRQLPLKLYQITSKFRDEMRPRFGLLRGKEFIMKDLYSFDATIEGATETYKIVSTAYESILNKIGIKHIRVVAAAGVMGGSLSHEFHFPANVGEAQIFTCSSCGHTVNIETSTGDRCDKCGSTSVTSTTGIEVGHTFLLGTKYSKPLNANYTTASGKSELLQMGSYGLGMTRLLAAAIEYLSLPDEIRWPLAFTPYTICIIPPKEGSKESSIIHLAEDMYHKLESVNKLKNNVIIDNRTDLTIGKRVYEARRTGYPYIVVIGRKAMQQVPLFEVYDVLKNHETSLEESPLIDYFTQLCSILKKGYE
ncbi:hypothetical protein L9F63_009275, partial [Diploptera punctata]